MGSVRHVCNNPNQWAGVCHSRKSGQQSKSDDDQKDAAICKGHGKSQSKARRKTKADALYVQMFHKLEEVNFSVVSSSSQSRDTRDEVFRYRHHTFRQIAFMGDSFGQGQHWCW